MEEKERKEKSDKLFDKGMECYNNQQYKEALKYFEACIKFSKNDRAELFIGVCKNNIPEEDKNNNNNSNNNYHKSYSYSGASSSNYSYQKIHQHHHHLQQILQIIKLKVVIMWVMIQMIKNAKNY